MQLGEVIRKYRKEKNMTQEEMADRLGVTAPAVNKWENGNSYPDIMLLVPIARLLGISLDTLLSYQAELTCEEIAEIVQKTDKKLKEVPYDEAFEWAKKQWEQYPNCEQLIWQTVVILEAQLLFQEPENADKYEKYLSQMLIRLLESRDENIRHRAADSLFGICMRKKQYDRAEEYLAYFPQQDSERKRKQL